MIFVNGTKSDLLAPLQAVSGIVEKRQSFPILSNVLVERRDGKVTMLTTDIEMQILTEAAVDQVSGDVATTINTRKLQDILRSLPDKATVTLNLEDNKRIALLSGKSRFALQTLPATDYPKMSPTEPTVALTLNQGQFKGLLALVQYAMAQQDIRYYLNGLLIAVSAGELRAIATDGHRLAYASCKLDEETPDMEVILPRKTVLELSRLLGDNDEPIHILFSDKQATFRFAKIELISKLIDGKFPDYKRVIPAGYSKKIAISRVSFLQSLQRAAILTSDKFRGVRLVLAPGSIKIVSSNSEHEEATEELDIPYSGDVLDVGFNVTYLIDVLNNLNCNDVELHLQDANSSALFTLPDNDTFKYVVMPMRI